MSDEYGYGLWFLVVVNSVIFIAFAVSFFQPRSNRNWRVLGGFSSFVVAIFTEMRGWLLASGWKPLFAAIKVDELATTGPYARLRHPQYAGLVLVVVGFLLQWPTLATLAVREEQEVAERFGEAWERYVSVTPRFFPRLQRPPSHVPDTP